MALKDRAEEKLHPSPGDEFRLHHVKNKPEWRAERAT